MPVKVICKDAPYVFLNKIEPDISKIQEVLKH